MIWKNGLYNIREQNSILGLHVKGTIVHINSEWSTCHDLKLIFTLEDSLIGSFI